MNLEKVSGYRKLSVSKQELFKQVYEKHMECVGDRASWQVKSVAWVDTYLKVTFKNGEWLHYTRSGTWY